VGLLASYVEQAEDPDEPAEALLVAQRLTEIYADRLYLALSFHGSPSEKVINRGLLAVAQHLELGVVATNAVRFATPEDALAHTVLRAIRCAKRADGVLNQASAGGDLPMVAAGCHPRPGLPQVTRRHVAALRQSTKPNEAGPTSWVARSAKLAYARRS
jgi:hypothetical protein